MSLSIPDISCLKQPTSKNGHYWDWLTWQRPTHSSSLILSNTQSCFQWLQTSPCVVSNLGYKKKKLNHKHKANIYWIFNYITFLTITLFDKIRRWFLHDSADTWGVLPLDPVAQDGSSDIHDTDLSTALDYLDFCFFHKTNKDWLLWAYISFICNIKSE